MPVLDGIEATRRIRAAGDDAPRVLVVTTFDLDEYVFEALRAGASGFLLKDAPRAELLRGDRGRRRRRRAARAVGDAPPGRGLRPAPRRRPAAGGRRPRRR